jgi:hypothetical protein
MKPLFKVQLLSLYFIFQINPGYSQNLVINPSFEQFDTCPDNLYQINRAIGWHTSKNTPDFFNVCSTDTFPSGQYMVSVPSNGFGYRTPASGNAYTGLSAGTLFSGAREYISSQLLTQLQPGTKYYMSYRVSLAGQANPNNRCGINKLGMLFSTIQFNNLSNAPVCDCAQVAFDSVITDTLNWSRITGSFVADSSYTFINIGRFAYDSSTNVVQVLGSSCIAYYYIDDICVSTDSAYSYNYIWTEINENILKPEISIFPNPAIDFINIKFPFLSETYSITIYDIFGREVYFNPKVINEVEHIPIKDNHSNLLFIRIASKNHIFNYKIIKKIP